MREERGRRHDVTSEDVNGFLRETIGPDVSAKDSRTWHAAVLAAVALVVSLPVAGTPTARRRAVTRACAEVSEHLGNTSSACRSSCVDPRVVDLFGDGVTIAPALGDLGADASFGHPATHGLVGRAVQDLLRTDPSAVSRSVTRAARPARPRPGRRRPAATGRRDAPPRRVPYAGRAPAAAPGCHAPIV